ncbi:MULTISPECIES: primosomal replication protein N [Gammaproteobacteria]|uniref:primosomal replication protein N n=1 Tax=Gammaproteobacteria TaxID=1236 RepID=UPI000DCF701A|nr:MULTISPECIES: primosomal replication protein N [Gammaproteobacteria]RTE87667.1 primosomal replication protein N [Aliidiomarina sp. B3213]TCZ92549.1 primosomal replication protein N [Lysobacter sp. N42]
MADKVDELGVNQLILSGVLVKPPRQSKSPAGIPHLHLVLEHRSTQVEAELPRQCYARMQVIASGEWSQRWSQLLTLGDAIKVTGFIQRHEDKHGMGKLVLHAQNIEQV